MIVLGLSFAHHDSAAALVVDGEPTVAIAQERLSRLKRDGISCGRRRLEIDAAIDHCLAVAGVGREDVDLTVWSHVDHADPAMLTRALQAEGAQPLPGRRPPAAIPHHFAHACTAFHLSGFHDAAVLVMDGAGGPPAGLCATAGAEADAWRRGALRVWHAHSLRDRQGDLLREVESYYTGGAGGLEPIGKVVGRACESTIGPVYAHATRVLFGSPLECGKTMGLAAYGEPLGAGLFFAVESGDPGPPIHRLADSEVRIRIEAAISAWRDQNPDVGINECAAAVAYAATLQAETEAALATQVRWLREVTRGGWRLCFAGGVALNCVANGRLAAATGFDEIYVPFAPGDDGVALGAALWGAEYLGDVLSITGSPFLSGPDERFGGAGGTRGPYGEVPTAAEREVVEALMRGEVVAWHVGVAEFGPRALGRRCFLADPRRAEMRDRMNAVIKRREGFRPFAPVVLPERVEDYFERRLPSRYMSFATAVRPGTRERVPAVVHADGTARYQVLDDSTPELVRVLREFQRRTGLGMLLLTSLNLAGRPLSQSRENSLDCFRASSADLLYLDGSVLRRAGP